MAKREVEERFVFDNGMEISTGTRISALTLTHTLLLEIGRLLRVDYTKGCAICEEIARECKTGCPLHNMETENPFLYCLPMTAAHWVAFILGYNEGYHAGNRMQCEE